MTGTAESSHLGRNAMSEMEYQRREGAKERKRRAEHERTKDWEKYKKRPEWKKMKEDIRQRERDTRRQLQEAADRKFRRESNW